jgi:hypothetical protein
VQEEHLMAEVWCGAFAFAFAWKEGIIWWIAPRRAGLGFGRRRNMI